MLLLKIDVLLVSIEVAAKLVHLDVEVLLQLLAPNLLR